VSSYWGQVKEAKKFCSPINPIVKNLSISRNHFLAHSNFEVTFGDSDLFQKKYSLQFRDIEKLIHDGFDIVNSYAGTFGASYFPNSKSTNYPVHDYQFILDALKTRRKK
jgi:hypothetical protein